MVNSQNSRANQVVRLVCWGTLTFVFAYVLNNFLIHVGETARLLDGGWVSIALYALAAILAIILTVITASHSLIRTSAQFTSLSALVVRGAFWAVFLVGLVDGLISFLRIEGLAIPLFGEDLAGDLNRQSFRGAFVHVPVVILGFVLAFLTRGLGFIWLTLLVVFAQLTIVITVNVYSYEQAFLSDLVRFWYAALFLFAAAHTLLAGGHVRVDVVFAGLSAAAKRQVNFWGSVWLGLPLAWVTLVAGTWDKTRVINAPILNFDFFTSAVERNL